MKIVWNVPEIMCEGCAGSITNALNEISDISHVEVNVEAKLVSFESAGPNVEGIARTRMNDIGFEVRD